MAGVVDDTLSELLHYAAKTGVELTGIAPRRLPGRGYGIVAMRDIEEGETVLAVPRRALRTLATVPRWLARRLDGEVSVHGILAADLALDGVGVPGSRRADVYAPWNAVLPTRDDLEAGMPLLWPAELRELLPLAAYEALTRQQAKLAKDWGGLQAARKKGHEGAEDRDTIEDATALAALDESAYRHAWLLVNSRTFYYASGRTAQPSPAAADDRMAMQPVADLFNHAAEGGCRVTSSATGFAFVADRRYAAGAEVPISYGAHADDTLLVEYGFVLAPPGTANRWDEVALDDAVLPRLDRAARADLADAGFLGRYRVDADTPGGCYRTQIALRRILCGSSEGRKRAWRQFVEGGGEVDGGVDGDAAAVDVLVAACLGDMADRARRSLQEIDHLAATGVGAEAQRALLARRWRQIEAVLDQAAAQLAGE